jgi:RNA polymerase sigma-70 factor (ECF subfamily)
MASLRALAESRLVLFAQAGDDAAFEELVQRLQASVRGLLRKLSSDPALADELAQIAFIKAWRSLSRLRNAGSVRAWMRRIVIRVWLDHVRARKFDLSADTEVVSDVGAADNADRRLDVDAALARLSPGARACTILFYVEGMTQTEIAAATGISSGTVKSHIARSTARLRTWLKEWSPAS